MRAKENTNSMAKFGKDVSHLNRSQSLLAKMMENGE